MFPCPSGQAGMCQRGYSSNPKILRRALWLTDMRTINIFAVLKNVINLK